MLFLLLICLQSNSMRYIGWITYLQDFNSFKLNAIIGKPKTCQIAWLSILITHLIFYHPIIQINTKNGKDRVPVPIIPLEIESASRIIGTFRFAWTDTCDVHSRQLHYKDVDRHCLRANLKVSNIWWQPSDGKLQTLGIKVN